MALLLNKAASCELLGGIFLTMTTCKGDAFCARYTSSASPIVSHKSICSDLVMVFVAKPAAAMTKALYFFISPFFNMGILAGGMDDGMMVLASPITRGL